MTKYKVYRLYDSGGEKNNISDYQKLLDEGWVPLRESPMGSPSGGCSWFASLCVLTKEEPDPVVSKKATVEVAEHMKSSNLMSDEDILVNVLNYKREDAKEIVHRMRQQKLHDLKLQVMGQNPNLFPAVDEDDD